MPDRTSTLRQLLTVLLWIVLATAALAAQTTRGIQQPGAPTPPVTQLTREGKNFEPMWSPDGRRIAFESTRDGNLEIYVMNADGTDQRRLTKDAGADASPSWSPDGSKILFFSNRKAREITEDTWKLYVMDADGSHQRCLSRGSRAELRPVMSPDGRLIAFDAWVEETGTHQIIVANGDGSEPKRLTWTRAYESAPQWSSDGSRIAFFSLRDYLPYDDLRETNSEIYVMDSDGTNQKRLTFLKAKSTYPYWSPDDSSIAFETDVTGDMEIFVVEVEGSRPTNVTNHPGRDTSVSWSPVNDRLAFVSDRNGKADIYVMELPSRPPLPQDGTKRGMRQE